MSRYSKAGTRSNPHYYDQPDDSAASEAEQARAARLKAVADAAMAAYPAPRQNPMKCRNIRIPGDGSCKHCHCAHCNKPLPANSRAYGLTPDASSLPAGVSMAEQPVIPVCSLGCAAAVAGAAS